MSAETVLVTGASSGIGGALARLFAAGGARLVLVARSREKLEQLAAELRQGQGVESRVMVRDLADPAAPAAICDELQSAGVEVDVLVNNAGFGATGPFAEIPLARQLDMLQVDLVALTHLTRLLLPPMIQRHRGGVLNVASTAAFQPGPNMAVYFAAKAYVLSLSEALFEELASAGVVVTCLAPGPTATGFFRAANMERARLARMGLADVDAVARAGYRGFRRGKRLVVPGFRNRLTAACARLAPRGLVLRIAKLLVAEV
jgi:hypothetical protein